MTASDWMVVGRIAGAFGVRGEIKIEPYTDDPDRFQSLASVYIEPNYQRLEIQRARRHKNLVIVKLEGIETPEAVRSLGTPDVAIPRRQALPLEAGGYFLEDIVGMRVRSCEGAEVGEVTDVLRTGANDVFVVGSGRAALLLPATRDAIARIDTTDRIIVANDWALQPYV